MRACRFDGFLFLIVLSGGSAAVNAGTDPSTGASPPVPSGSRPLTSTDLNNLGVTAAQEGQFDDGVGYLRQALQLNPADTAVHKNLSGMLTDWAARVEQAGDVTRAEQLLQEAVQHDPENGRAFVQLGDLAYFKRSDFSQALAYWKRANGKLPSSEWQAVADRMSQAQRDQAIERRFISAQTVHFDIRLQRQGGVDLEAVSRLLEEAYHRLISEFGVGPPKVAVIVYTEEDLRRTYNQRDWAVGFYDGRLRLLGNEIGTEFARALVAHELAHAFLHYAYGEALPVWVHEGFAQHMEGSRPHAEEEQRLEAGIVDGTLWIPLKWLDQRFTHPSDRVDVGRAYVEARLVVEVLIARHGVDQFRAFLKALSTGTPAPAAYDMVFAPDRWARTDQSILQ